MGFKLFRSTEDKMKEAMFGNLSPVGKDIQNLLYRITDGVSDPFYMADYDKVKMYNISHHELVYLAAALKSMKTGLALFADAGVFFADPARVILFKNSIQKLIDADENNLERGYPWLQLMSYFWSNKIPISNIKVFIEGFEVETFVDGEKVRKVLVEKPPRSFE